MKMYIKIFFFLEFSSFVYFGVYKYEHIFNMINKSFELEIKEDFYSNLTY